MKAIIIALFALAVLETGAQFTNYSTPETPVTTQELIALLTGAQRVGILETFVTQKSPGYCYKTYGVKRAVYSYFYVYLKQINLVGDTIIKANPTLTENQFKLAVYNVFSSEFTQAQISIILDWKFYWSDGKGNANWDYFKAGATKELE